MNKQELVVRESRRQQRRHTIKESRNPQTGAYWWVPKPADGGLKWRLLEFYDAEYDDTLHFELWPQVLELLALWWQKDYRVLERYLDVNYTALPRGRVNEIKLWRPTGDVKGWSIFHGNDAPAGSAGIPGVIVAFNLSVPDHMKRVKVEFDGHETVSQVDAARLQRVLGIDLGLAGRSASA